MKSRLAEELGSGRVYEKATKQDLPAKPIRRRAQSEALAYCRFGSCSYLDVMGFMVYQRVGERWTLCLRKN